MILFIATSDLNLLFFQLIKQKLFDFLVSAQIIINLCIFWYMLTIINLFNNSNNFIFFIFFSSSCSSVFLLVPALILFFIHFYSLLNIWIPKSKNFRFMLHSFFLFLLCWIFCSIQLLFFLFVINLSPSKWRIKLIEINFSILWNNFATSFILFILIFIIFVFMMKLLLIFVILILLVKLFMFLLIIIYQLLIIMNILHRLRMLCLLMQVFIGFRMMPIRLLW